MRKAKIAIDTNVFVSALRSNRGASFRLILLLGEDRFGITVSVPLVLEYEKASKSMLRRLHLSAGDIDDIIDYFCAVAEHQQIFYLWRPFLRHPKDDMVLELAVAAQCTHIVTYNKKDFCGIDAFGIAVMSPQEFLKHIGEVP